jgi:integrase/recombinase XerD
MRPPKPVLLAHNTQAIAWFIDQLLTHDQLSQHTLSAYQRDLAKFCHYCEHQTWDSTPFHLKTIAQDHLHRYFSDYLTDSPDKKSSQARLLAALKRFYLQCVIMNIREDTPAKQLKCLSMKQHLPQFFSETHVSALLAAPNPTHPLGIRDKAILEVLYATGLRVSELTGLRLTDLDLVSSLIIVTGKGNKERLVPLSNVAQTALLDYINHSRPVLLKGLPSHAVFISQKRTTLTRQMIWIMIQQYTKQADLPHFSPHSLRHAFATHLVNHGADLRSVQLLLGHEDISTTEIYTHVANLRLQQLHQMHHPRA